MKAATVMDPEDFRFPLCATPKLDGIRALTHGGQLWSKSGKLIPNQHMQKFANELPDGLDGELVSGDFSSTTSAVMSRDGTPDFTYYVFDRVSSEPYWTRIHTMPLLPLWCSVLLPTPVNNLKELLDFEHPDYEGLILRSSAGPYVHGRTTLSQHYVLKWKRFSDSEATIVAIHEGTSRVVLRGIPTPNGTCGSLECRDLYTGQPVSVGGGLTHALRATIWQDRASYIGRIIRYRFQLNAGYAPRFPRFAGFREDL